MQNLSPRAVWLYLVRLDDRWASLCGASLPPTPGLTASSLIYGREFATRFFQLRLAATPCVSLRLPSSAPIGSFHPTRFCPCWAHIGSSAGDCAPAPSHTTGRAGFRIRRLGYVSDVFWASLFPASLPPAPGLTAVSCSCGREFANRFFQLHLAATPCGSATVAVIGPDWLLSSN